MKLVASHHPQGSLPNRFAVACIASTGGEMPHKLDDRIIAEHNRRGVLMLDRRSSFCSLPCSDLASTSEHVASPCLYALRFVMELITSSHGA
jgi:hypothetical protein